MPAKGTPKVRSLFSFSPSSTEPSARSSAKPQVLMRTRWELLAAASLAFGMSLAVEAFWYGEDVGVRVVIEDGAKFMGVLALAAWSVSSASDLIRSVVTTNHSVK